MEIHTKVIFKSAMSKMYGVIFSVLLNTENA